MRSIWDTFAARPGAVRGGHDGRVATDHRNRWRDDVQLLADLGIPAYRFSVAWPRVADGATGLGWYSALVDGLLAAGVEPVVTLYHWDLPQSLEDAGGWPARPTAEAFGDYAAAVGTVLGDRVRRWCTVNEPWCAAMLGYAAGVHAPGRTDPGAAMAAAHHLLLGHGLAVDALRSTATAADLEVALTVNPYPVVPAGERPEDLDAARRVDGIANRLWYDPVLRGEYPADVVDDVAAVTDLGFVRDGDLAVIGRTLDALGVNYYRRHHPRCSPGASAIGPWPGSPDIELVQPSAPATDGGWAVEPGGLVEVLDRLDADYPGHPPVYVHENGAAYDDGIDDRRRVAFLEAHVQAAREAIGRGTDLRGFFVWSFLDNFEWAEGYDHRFGIVAVDWQTLARTPRSSARWLGAVAAGNGSAAVD